MHLACFFLVSLYYLYNLHLRKIFPGHAKVSCHGFTRVPLRLCNTLQATEAALPCYITKHTDIRSTPLATLDSRTFLSHANNNDDDRECTGRCCLQVLRVTCILFYTPTLVISYLFRTVRLVLCYELESNNRSLIKDRKHWQCATARQPLGNRSIGCPRRCGARGLGLRRALNALSPRGGRVTVTDQPTQVMQIAEQLLLHCIYQMRNYIDH
ncbi:hypothetical protein F5888DRAFT_820339 [Russula emetica]|nr:hypothetical protein F5888DRAFT_820339 [Russula emetica]